MVRYVKRMGKLILMLRRSISCSSISYTAAWMRAKSVCRVQLKHTMVRPQFVCCSPQQLSVASPHDDQQASTNLVRCRPTHQEGRAISGLVCSAHAERRTLLHCLTPSALPRNCHDSGAAPHLVAAEHMHQHHGGGQSNDASRVLQAEQNVACGSATQLHDDNVGTASSTMQPPTSGDLR